MSDSTTKHDPPHGPFPRPLFTPETVPEPRSAEWVDQLRWLVAVMDGSDSALPFVASLLSDCLRHSGYLTEKQHQAASNIFFRVRFEYLAGRLECQRRPKPPAPPPDPQSATEPAGTWSWYVGALDLSDRERALLSAICAHIDPETGEARVTQQTLIKAAGFEKWQDFRDALKVLEARGVIEVDRVARAHPKNGNLPHGYRLAGREVKQG